MNVIDLIPGGRLVQGLVVAAVVASVIGAVTYAVHSYNEGLRDEGRVEVQVKWNAEKIVLAEDAAAASEAARAKEKTLIAKNLKVANDYQAEKKRRAADAVVTAGRLQQLQAALDSVSAANPAAAAGADDPRNEIIHRCSSALIGMDKYAKELADKTSALQIYASELCVTK